MTEWQPIETAPKDGTRVILWGPYAAEPTVAAWDGRDWQCYCDGAMAIESQGDFVTEWMTFSVPSHWMPLPPPPATPSAREDNER